MKTLSDITLTSGKHTGPGQGLCFMEAVAWYVDELHSDRPKCVSPAIAAAGRVFNDWLPDHRRDEILKPLLLEVVGTNTTIDDEIIRAKISSQYAAKFAEIAAALAAASKWRAEESAISAAFAEEYAALAEVECAKGWSNDAIVSVEWSAEAAAKSARWASKYTESDAIYALIGEMILDMCKVGR